MPCIADVAVLAILLAAAPRGGEIPALSLAGGAASVRGVSLAPLTPPDPPTDDQQLVELARLDAASAEAVVVAVIGRFAGGEPTSGTVGVVLLPDTPRTAEALETDDRLLLPLRLEVSAGGTGRWLEGSAPPATLAFPSYRVFAYNLTAQAVAVDVHFRAATCPAALPKP
jgi:hypothetical protein